MNIKTILTHTGIHKRGSVNSCLLGGYCIEVNRAEIIAHADGGKKTSSFLPNTSLQSHTSGPRANQEIGTF
jgi:hypothetical protein